MFENPRRGRQARRFTRNVSKILDLKSSSEQIFFRMIVVGCPWYMHCSLVFLVDILTLFNKCIYIRALLTYFLHLHYYRHIYTLGSACSCCNCWFDWSKQKNCLFDNMSFVKNIKCVITFFQNSLNGMKLIALKLLR